MLVSTTWLNDYVPLDMPLAEIERRVMMAGLNHESTESHGDDAVIDFEVTSNRPDCLGHLGIAREIAVLWGRDLKLPPAEPRQGATPIEQLTSVRIDCPDLCWRYTARLIRGVKVGPSPKWMQDRLEAIGITPINNIVDISNYVLMECGQPLHTFDFAKLQGRQIIVRRPRPGETIKAIDHKDYALGPEMCVIADGQRPVAIGGVMGGATTEISSRTTEVLIEAAEFAPTSVRGTARQLNLHSDSSYRFERKIDPEGVDWASRRCCQLILELAGGELAAGVIDVGQAPPPRTPITLRQRQLTRILGIVVPPADVVRILTALGCQVVNADDSQTTVIAPSWRRDLTREIDLIEEVARIYGYDKIPEDVRVPMSSSVRTRDDRVLGRIRQVLTGAGFDEALTLSVVDETLSAAASPWTEATALQTLTPVIRGSQHLRRSLIPSLLAVRRSNESLANPVIELFEIARVYLSQGNQLPAEELMIGLTSGRTFGEVKGVIEALLAALNPTLKLEATPASLDLLDAEESCRLCVGGQLLGVLGKVSPDGQRKFELRGATVVAELKVALLVLLANLVPKYEPLAAYPAVVRDLNLVVDETVRWAELAATVAAVSGDVLEALDYADTYRDPKRLGVGKKSLLLRLTLRSKQGTLTNQQADQLRDQIVAACGEKHGAQLRA